MSSSAVCLFLVCLGTVVLEITDAKHHHHHHHKHHKRTENANATSEQDEPSIEARDKLCVYKNVTYPAGTKFRPDSCTFCRCPRRGGKATCSVMDCKFEPGCLMYETEPDECCGRCMEQGCLHSDGKVYPKGMEVRTDPCTRCFCPKDSPHTICMKTQCPTAMCVDSVKLPNQCCGYCPRGPNCRYKGSVLSANKVVRIDKCVVCHCPNPIKDRGLTAVCTNVCQMKKQFLRKQIETKNRKKVGEVADGTEKHLEGEDEDDDTSETEDYTADEAEDATDETEDISDETEDYTDKTED